MAVRATRRQVLGVALTADAAALLPGRALAAPGGTAAAGSHAAGQALSGCRRPTTWCCGRTSVRRLRHGRTPTPRSRCTRPPSPACRRAGRWAAGWARCRCRRLRDSTGSRSTGEERRRAGHDADRRHGRKHEGGGGDAPSCAPQPSARSGQAVVHPGGPDQDVDAQSERDLTCRRPLYPFVHLREVDDDGRHRHQGSPWSQHATSGAPPPADAVSGRAAPRTGSLVRRAAEGPSSAPAPEASLVSAGSRDPTRSTTSAR